MLTLNPKMLPRLDELEADLVQRRNHATANGWKDEIRKNHRWSPVVGAATWTSQCDHCELLQTHGGISLTMTKCST
ncbi:MAG TPA: hypothetical protein VGD71_13230 [Kribbella sp.]|jgi:hypothetical protein